MDFRRASDQEEKTKNLVLYICEKLKDEDTFGSTVLNKVLYYIDSVQYLKTGSPISKFGYIRQKNGPTPKPAQFLRLRDELINEGRMGIEDKESFGYIQKRPVAITRASREVFSGEEMSIIDQIIEAFKDVNATIASYVSHHQMAWQSARNMEELPLYTYLITRAELTEEDIAWGNSKANEYREQLMGPN